MADIDFSATFKALTDFPPLGWQERLYQRFMDDDIPDVCDLPTGLGKTLVIAIWLIALAAKKNQGKPLPPRRLVYVVNRRTIVDQATTTVVKIRERLLAESPDPKLNPLIHALSSLSAVTSNELSKNGEEKPPIIAVSTLRGQLADNAEWRQDPSRPAIVIGTVDMIGSRLLFSGYGCGFKTRPLHAGFLGQDSLIVHDEAHLEPAFQCLLEQIESEQREGRFPDRWPLRVMQLSATARGECETNRTEKDIFELSPDERTPKVDDGSAPEELKIVWQRLSSPKAIHLHEVEDDKKVGDEVVKIALDARFENRAVVIFVRELKDVETVMKKLLNEKKLPLTGTMRGWERDKLVEDPIFQRFLPESSRSPEIEPAKGTVYLVCTSAGEVGVDISADHLVCDLSTFDSMAQRLGRVNRFGKLPDTEIHVVYPKTFGGKDLDSYRAKSLELIKSLNGDGSPRSIDNLPKADRLAAFAPQPTMLPPTDILLDAWALTSIRGKMPGRPDVEPYLHGIRDWEPSETYVAWREEVGIITDELLTRYPPSELLDEYPLKPHELLRDRTDRVWKELETLAKRCPKRPVWIVDDQGEVEVLPHMTELTNWNKKQFESRLGNKTVLLPHDIGGLTKQGMLEGISDSADDVADKAIDEHGLTRRQRIWDGDDVPNHLRVSFTIDTRPDADESEDEEGLEGEGRSRFWYWCDRPHEGGRTSYKPVMWDTHVRDVVNHAKEIVDGLSLPPEIARAVMVAAELHDHGKRRELFQIALGNRAYPAVLWAKSGKRGARLPETFRHEFASVLDSGTDDAFNKLDDELKDLVIHLIAAHHGRARPHFTVSEAFDPERSTSDAEVEAIEVPRRFGRLQRKYGRWGLAYLESLLRAADWAASARPSEFAHESETKR